jgi:NADH-quinone oxidoreductase subunit G
MKIAELSQLDSVLIIGSFLRKDHPLIAQRLRQSAKRGAKITLLHSAGDDQLIKLAGQSTVPPSQLPSMLAQVVKAVCAKKNVAIETMDTDATFAELMVSVEAEQIAQSLVSGRNTGIMLGNFAQQHPQAATLHALAHQLASLLGGELGFLGEAANSLGAYVAKAVPQTGGLAAETMLAKPRRAYVLLGVEPELDCADGMQALAALSQAASVIVLSPFKSKAALGYADVLLPVSPFAETSGTFINCEGRVQSFYAAVKPLAETRPAWKVLRVLANLLDIPGFDYSSSDEIKAEALGLANGEVLEFVSGLDNGISGVTVNLISDIASSSSSIERVADVPIHFADMLARYAPSLQKTKDAAIPVAHMNGVMLARFGIASGDLVKLGAGDTANATKISANHDLSVTLRAELDASLPDNVVRIASGHPATVAVGPMFTTLRVEKA